MIPLQQINWDLVSNLYGSYAKNQQEAERQQLEQAMRLRQMQLLQMQIEEKQRERKYEEGMLPYMEQREAEIRRRGEGLKEPLPMLVEPQGPPPPTPGWSDAGITAKVPQPQEPTGLEPYYQPPDPRETLLYAQQQQDATPNRYAILSEYAYKQGRPKEALAYDEMAIPNKIARIDSLLQKAADAGDAAMFRTLLTERRSLEDQIAVTEKKYTERQMHHEATLAKTGEKDTKYLVDIGGKKVPFAFDKQGNGFAQMADGKWVPHVPTGPLEPIGEGKPGQSFLARAVDLYKSKGYSEEEALRLAQKDWEDSMMRVGSARIPSETIDPRLPPGFGFSRRTGMHYIETPEGKKNVPPEIPMAVVVANYQGNLGAYKTLSTQHAQTKVAIDSAMYNADTLLKASDEFKRGNYPPINQVQQWLQSRVASPESQAKLQQFRMALLAFSREYMRVTTGASRSAAELTEAAQKKVDDVLSPFANWDVVREAITQAKKEMTAVDMGNVNTKNKLIEHLSKEPWKEHSVEIPKPIPEKSEYEKLMGWGANKFPPPTFSGQKEGEIMENRTRGESWVWRNGKWEPYFGKKK